MEIGEFFRGLKERRSSANPRERAEEIISKIIDAVTFGRVPSSILKSLKGIDEDTRLERRILFARASEELKKPPKKRRIIILMEEKAFRGETNDDLCFVASGKLAVGEEPKGNAVLIMLNPNHPLWKRKKTREGLRMEEREISAIIDSLVEAQAMVEGAEKRSLSLLTAEEFVRALEP